MEELRWLSEPEMQGWDAFVEGHPQGWLCHLSGWKHVIEKSFPHIRGSIAASINCSTGAVEAGLPIYHVKSSLTGSRIVCAPFATLFDPLVCLPEQLEMLLNAVLAFAKAAGTQHIELRTLHTAALFTSPCFAASTAYKLHTLELCRPPEELMHSFSRSNIRQNISKAQKAPLRAYAASTWQDLKAFYTLYVESRQHLGLPALPLQFFQTLRDEFSEAGQVIFLIAAYKDQPVAALAALQFNGRFSVDYLGWDRNFKQVSPSPFILWEAIKLAYAAGCTVFDFGRTSVANTGLLKFKRHWGAQEHDLFEYFYPPEVLGRRRVQKETTMAYRFIRCAARVAPEPFYRILSGFCYQHLG